MFLFKKNLKSQDEKKYFIVGTQKSGTTWLRDCLDLFVPFCKPEWYFPEVAEGIHKVVESYGSSLPEDERRSRAISATRTAWKEISGALPGEKSAYPCSSALTAVRPDLHPRAVSLLRQHFPDCRVAVIVRDPRAVYNSLSHYLNGFRPGWSDEIDVKELALEWSRQNLAWASDTADVVVRYEDLKNNFDSSLDNVLSKMNIDHDAKDIDRARSLVFSVDKLRPRQPEIYRTGTIDEWRSKIGDENAKIIRDNARDAMIKFGYSE